MKNTKQIASLGLFVSIEILMALVPALGFIPIPFFGINATTLHIPVIICAIVLGLKPGVILGTTFGLLSVITNTFRPNITSFVFSPFYDGGNFYSLIIAILPRIMIAIVSFFIFKITMKISKNQTFATSISAFLASMTSTVLVMVGIYFFFGESYAIARNTIVSELLPLLIGIITFNGIIEAFVAVILVTTICRVLLKIKKN